MSLFSQEELQSMYDRAQCAGFVYQARTLAQWENRAAPKTRAEKCEGDRRTLLEVVRDFPDATVAELATAAERSPSWVRKHLRAAGISLTKPPRQKRQKEMNKP
jgi:transposase